MLFKALHTPSPTSHFKGTTLLSYRSESHPRNITCLHTYQDHCVCKFKVIISLILRVVMTQFKDFIKANFKRSLNTTLHLWWIENLRDIETNKNPKAGYKIRQISCGFWYVVIILLILKSVIIVGLCIRKCDFWHHTCSYWSESCFFFPEFFI